MENEEDYTEGITRFKKIVNAMGLYVPPDEQLLIEQNELNADEMGTYPAVHAYVNEECFQKNRGFLIACINDCVYMCLESTYQDEVLYCNGSVPAWSYNDNMLIEHLGDLIREYKIDLVNKRLLKMQRDFN